MAVSLLFSAAAGALVWWLWLRPIQQNHYERQRRSYGLPPKRELPEDRR